MLKKIALSLPYLSLFFMFGCKTVQVAVPELYYAVEYELVAESVSNNAHLFSEPLLSNSGKILRKGIRVGILPPDECLSESAVTGDARKVKKTSLALDCGVLLSSLERAIANAGYEVISWRTLRGLSPTGIQKTNFDIDVLFEINELSFGFSSLFERQASNLRFQIHTGRDKVYPTQVKRSVAERCANMVHFLTKNSPTDYGATINVKATEVKTGRAVWSFQNSVKELQYGERDSIQRTVYFKQGNQPTKRAIDKVALGKELTLYGSLFGAAALGLGIGSTYMNPSPEKDIAEGAAIGLGVPGALMLIPGVVLWGMGNEESLDNDLETLKEYYEEPDEILCVNNYRSTPPWLYVNDKETWSTDDELVSGYSAERQMIEAQDFSSVRHDALMKEVVATFIESLSNIAEPAAR